MKKRTIVLASILKPIDDTRMFEKFGISLSDSGDYNVLIIGYPATVKPAYPNVEFITSQPFARLSIGRWIAPLKVFLKLRKVKHDILIVNTHELLLVGMLNRIFFGVKIIYDIQENYYRNILHTDAFPSFIRSVLALWVRTKEKLTAPFFHWFLLAEKGYEKEFSFTGKRFTIIENKPRVSTHLIHVKRLEITQLLFSGTLAESTGVFQAINLVKNLHEFDNTIRLHIIGYAAKKSTYLRIQDEISSYSFITLTGGNHLVPHQEIMEAISKADFGIIIYPPSTHTQNSMPTKLYEYVASKLPILLQDHKPWVEFCKPFHAAIVLAGTSSIELLSKMKTEAFYTK
ncbi:MAG: glycosyltransferase, partial [Bacteroidia bacterium]|nr:glycosyltransferase [Bacteroidia bacterium]